MRLLATLLPALLALGCTERASAQDGPPPAAAADAGREAGARDGGRRAEGDATPVSDASLDAGEPEGPDPMTLDGSVSTSIGSPNDGRLEGGVPFPARAPGARRNPRRLNPGGHYGTVELVQTLLRAAAVVERELPGSELVVNDLSYREGGDIYHHGSHRSGRDADVLFYLLDEEGGPIPSKGVPLDTKGRGWDFDDLLDPSDDVRVKLDVPRTWRFLQALAEDPEAAVQRVYVAEHLRTILVDHAKRIRAPRVERERVEMLTCQPGTPHDDHLHIRVFCTPEDTAAGCEDTGPIYPYWRRALAAQGATPVLARPRPGRRGAKTTVSAEEAREKAPPMHWKVKAFLDLRETWSKQPHPGRPYCM